MATPQPECHDVVVIGAGWNGVGVSAALKASGVEDFVVLEQGSGVGDFWARHYDRLCLHSPDHVLWNSPPELSRDMSTFKTKHEVVEYFKRYLAHHNVDIQQHFHFGVKVLNVHYDGDIAKAKEEDHAENHLWQIQTTAGDYRAKIVCVATSILRVSRIPHIPGNSDFIGTLIHSSEYKNAEPFKGRRVLIVGSGNSAAEEALDLYEGGAAWIDIQVRSPRAFISIYNVRRMAKIGTFLGLGPTPSNLRKTFRYTRSDREFWEELAKMDKGMALLTIDMRRWGITPPSRFGIYTTAFREAKFPVIDWGVVPLIKRGEIGIITSEIERITPTGVKFVGERDERPYDVIILATGYHPGLDEFLDQSDVLLSTEELHFPLPSLPPCKPPWQYPRTDGRCQSTVVPTLYFVGFDAGVFGGSTWGIYSWNAGERIAVQLGKMPESRRTLDTTNPPRGTCVLF